MNHWSRVFAEVKHDEDHRAQHVAVQFIGPRGASLIGVLSRNGAEDLRVQLTKALNLFALADSRRPLTNALTKIRRGVKGKRAA